MSYAHTFSTSESAEFLSLVDQIRAETWLVGVNLENNNNNATLAQSHAQKALSLLDNDTLGEIRERNNRIAGNLESGLKQLVGNVTLLTSGSQGQMIPQEKIQSINQLVMSLNDTMAEAVTVRVGSVQQNNATTWALALADLVNVVLSDYGNATGASFDLTDMSNMEGMAGMETDNATNMTMTTSNQQMQTSGNRSDANIMTMEANTTSSTRNMTTTIVDSSAYQSAQYLANNTILRLFIDILKPLTVSSNEKSVGNNANTSMTMQGGQHNSTISADKMASDIDRLEAGLQQLKDYINSKAAPNEVIIPAHSIIHPLLMQIYGLTIEQEEGEEHSDHTDGQ
jgi:hypothetical protein